MVNVLQAKGCCISAASDSTSTTCKTIFELWCEFFRIILCQTKISKSKIQVKCYVAIFICPAVKAVHLELVSNLKSGAFIAATRTFIARRGNCLNLYSDNGATFIGAQHELRELRKLLRRDHISQNFRNLQIQKHLHGTLFALWTSGGWRALYEISFEW